MSAESDSCGNDNSRARNIVRSGLPLFLMLCSTCATMENDPGTTRARVNARLAIIANPQTPADEILPAIRSLGPASESPNFWSAIAQNANYRASHRRAAVFALFRRHVRSGMTLSELAAKLDNATWLKDEEVDLIDAVKGEIPVEWTFEDTVFRMRVLPSSVGDQSAVYLRLAGKIDRQSFIRGLRNASVEQKARETVILEIGFSEPSAE